MDSIMVHIPDGTSFPSTSKQKFQQPDTENEGTVKINLQIRETHQKNSISKHSSENGLPSSPT